MDASGKIHIMEDSGFYSELAHRPYSVELPVTGEVEHLKLGDYFDLELDNLGYTWRLRLMLVSRRTTPPMTMHFMGVDRPKLVKEAA